jgi:hypothetical protein
MKPAIEDDEREVGRLFGCEIKLPAAGEIDA